MMGETLLFSQAGTNSGRDSFLMRAREAVMRANCEDEEEEEDDENGEIGRTMLLDVRAHPTQAMIRELLHG